jgi:fructose-1,6-bisphosphatase/inositol monophosphatase family enzyme
VDGTLELLHRVADEVAARLAGVTDWGLSGRRPTQYVADVEADAAAVSMLLDAGFGVLSEETGHSGEEFDRVVVIDPLDGSTNASRGVPWYATALCMVDDAGPAVALVVNQASGRRFEAVRGEGARSDGRPLAASGCTTLADALVGISGLPPDGRPGGWAQFRSLGASALDLALVAGGALDGFVDFSVDAHGVWDYLAASLICAEAGAVVVDALGRDLAVIDHEARRTPVGAATPQLLDQLLARRNGNGA